MAVVALCLVLYTRGFFSFLMLFGAVLVLDDHSSLSQLAKGAFAAVIAFGDWLASMMPPPPRPYPAAQPPDGVVRMARAFGEVLDHLAAD